MREPMGQEAGGGGGLSLILSVGEGGLKLNLPSERGGMRLNFEPYFAHFPTPPPPPPDNYCTVPYPGVRIKRALRKKCHGLTFHQY